GFVFVAIHSKIRRLSVLACPPNRHRQKERKNGCPLPHDVLLSHFSEFGAFVEIDRAWPPEGKGLARRGAPAVKRTSVFGFSCFLDQNQSIGTLSATRCLVNTAHSGNRFGTRICAIVAAAKQGRTAQVVCWRKIAISLIDPVS